MSTTETVLAAHLVMAKGCLSDALLTQIHDLFGIEHATIQVETGDRNYPCTLAPHHRV